MSNQGKKVKTSYDRGEPLEFTCGAGQMIKGFDAAVVDMQVGEKKTVHIPAADAYGELAGKDLNFDIELVEVEG